MKNNTNDIFYFTEEVFASKNKEDITIHCLGVNEVDTHERQHPYTLISDHLSATIDEDRIYLLNYEASGCIWNNEKFLAWLAG